MLSKILTKCNGCHACFAACPKNCIAMQENEEGFLYPHIDEQTCIKCGLCEKVCPINNPIQADEPITAYAAIHKEQDVRLSSSSGGVFTAIATEIISRGGVVFGAAFDEKFNVVHKGVNNVEDLQQLRGSKYVQSTIKDAYQRAERYLQAGKWVLFTGTPCQIGGLHAYLNKAYARLITQDIICHGVPSPMVWRKYLEYRKDLANGANPRKITFRSKDTGWKRYAVAISFDNNVEYCKGVYEDAMMKAFLQNLCLRESCYDCAYKTKARQSDITLADFWGIEHLHSEMDDDKGTSLVVIQTEKGAELFKDVASAFTLKQTDLDSAIAYNSAMIHSVNKPVHRDAFLVLVKQQGFSVAEKKYLKISFAKKCRRLLSRIKNKLIRK